MNRSLGLIFGMVLLVGLAFGLYVVRPALATPETSIAQGGIVTWRGGDGDHAWSNAGNWQDGMAPRPQDSVRFPAGAPDAVLDAGFDGIIGGIVMEPGYQGTLTLARSLTVQGDVQVAGGTFASGDAPLTIEGKATITGGHRGKGEAVGLHTGGRADTELRGVLPL